MRRSKQRPGDWDLIRDDAANVAERASAMTRLAADGVRGIRSVAEQWLTAEDPFLRDEAVGLLLIYWGRDTDVDAALRMLAEDPDWSVRSGSAHSLKYYLKRRDDHRDRIMEALVRQLENDPDDIVQSACYEELRQILYPASEWGKLPKLPDEFDRDRDVDWALLAPWRAQASEADRARRDAPPPPVIASLDDARRRAEQRAQDQALLHDEQADPDDRSRAMSRLAREAFDADDDLGALRPIAEGWLGHDEPWLRQIALTVLLGYGGTDADIEAGLRLLAQEPSMHVRRMAASTLESLVSVDRALAPDVEPVIERETIDRIATALVRQLELDSDWQVQRACYDAVVLLVIPHGQRPDTDKNTFDRDRDVDWDLLAPWRTPPEDDATPDDAAPG